jgi:radical SAM superfamily enzyme YgiQ (UPF0313 family)
MKILLVNPHSQRLSADALLPPLGLAFVAGAAQAARHQVDILDLNLGNGTDVGLRESFYRLHPQVVGITALTTNIKQAWSIAEKVKRFAPQTTVVLGGVHPTLHPRETLSNESVDYVVHGEGEETFVALLRHLEDPWRLAHIAGLAFRQGGEILSTGKRPPIRVLDQLPLPAYELLDMDRYATPQSASRKIAVMFTSRGCPFKCIFCDAHTVHGRGYRCHSPERVIEEIVHLRHLFGTREIFFKDSEFTLNKDRVARICGLILEKTIPIRWNCNARVGSLDLSLLKKMKAAGCRLIQYGVESGDQSILDTLQKGITTQQIEATFQATRQAGILTVANCMVGNPGETRASVDKTLALVKKIRADYINVNFIHPFPGTALYSLARNKNWLPDDYDPLVWKQDQCVMNATRMPTAELKTMVAYLQRGFYLRPSYILKRALSLNLVEWKKSIAGAWRLLGVRSEVF